MENINFDSLKRRRDLRIILPVFLVSIIACIDRVNISYAKLTMTQTLPWLSPEVYGFGALTVGAIGLGLSPFAHNMGVALFLICLSAIGIHASMGVWWTIPTTFLSGPAAAGSIALINSCGNLGGMFGPNMMAWVQAETGSFDMGYYLMAAFMFCAGVLVLTLKYKVNGAAKKDVLLDAKATVQPTAGH